MRILIAHSDPLETALSVQEVVDLCGVQPDQAINGLEAHQKLAAAEYDLCITCGAFQFDLGSPLQSELDVLRLDPNMIPERRMIAWPLRKVQARVGSKEEVAKERNHAHGTRTPPDKSGSGDGRKPFPRQAPTPRRRIPDRT